MWAINVIRHTNKPVMIFTPIAVSHQFVREGEKFGIEVHNARNGRIVKGINVVNYEQLEKFNPADFGGAVADEAGCVKHFESKTRDMVAEFFRTIPYRLLDTATPAPNDYIELGNSSEILGQLGYMDMLGRFFKNDQNTIKPMVYRDRGKNFSHEENKNKWRFKRHAEMPFWRWVCTWARAIRKPSDYGFENGDFDLPPLNVDQMVVEGQNTKTGFGFNFARTLEEQRAEKRSTLRPRCEAAAAIASKSTPSIAWCHLNAEGDLLERLIPDSVQVSGDDSEQVREEKFLAFVNGQAKTLITKPKIGGFGLNFQHCANMTFFPSHSFEQAYQCIRRCWRFGQTKPVNVTMVLTPGETRVLQNLKRKSDAASRMFDNLIEMMHKAEKLSVSNGADTQTRVPKWLS